MTVEVDLREIKRLLSKLNKKVDLLMEEREVSSIMALTERSLKDLFEGEPEIYSARDLKVKYQ